MPDELAQLAPIIDAFITFIRAIANIINTFAASIYPSAPWMVILVILAILYILRSKVGMVIFLGVSALLVYSLFVGFVSI